MGELAVEAARSGAWSRTQISGFIELTIVSFKAEALNHTRLSTIHAPMVAGEPSSCSWLLFLRAHIPEQDSQNGTMISVRQLQGSDGMPINTHIDARWRLGSVLACLDSMSIPRPARDAKRMPYPFE